MSRTQIRRGVFETNSSSTHSLQITGKNSNEIYDEILLSIMERYGKENVDMFFPDEFIDKKTLLLQGFNVPDGDEEGDVYIVMCSPMAKVQFLAMLIDHINEGYVSISDDMKNMFDRIIVEYLCKNGFNISDVKTDLKYSCHWLGDFYNENIDITYDVQNIFKSVDTFSKFINEILHTKTIVYKDEAYSPWHKPNIMII